MQKIKDYQGYNGFFDLRKWELPKKVFLQLWKIQEFLYFQNQNRKYLKKFMVTEWQKLQELTGKYQTVLFSYPKKQQREFNF